MLRTPLDSRTPMELNLYSKDVNDLIGEQTVYTGDPGHQRNMTIYGTVSSINENGSVMLQSYAWGGASGSLVFDDRARIIGILKAIDVNRSGVSPYPQINENIVWLSPPSSLELRYTGQYSSTIRLGYGRGFDERCGAMIKRICQALLIVMAGTSCSPDYGIVGEIGTETVYIEVPVEVENNDKIWVDHFFQPTSANGVDILWVIDMSGSMNDNEDKLLAGIEAMMKSLPATGWRLNMISNSPNVVIQDQQFPLVPGDTFQDAKDMYDNVVQGHFEMGFDPLKNICSAIHTLQLGCAMTQRSW